MDYEKDMQIDESALDVEWLNQPLLAMKYNKHYADCFRKLQEAEEHIKLIRSQLILRAQEDPEGCLGLPKATDKPVEAYYRQHEDHIEAKRDIINAQYELNIATAAKSEISFSRKSALENLVVLHGQNYFAGPSVPRDLSFEKMEADKQKEVDVSVATKLQRRKKKR